MLALIEQLKTFFGYFCNCKGVFAIYIKLAILHNKEPGLFSRQIL